MKLSFTRRDFLKLAGLLPFLYTVPPTNNSHANQNQPGKQNILILVFDAWSAANVSLYGYPHRTTPNLEKLAQNAIIYHNHFAGSHFTSPGTASLLTGTTPWTHQAFNHNSTVLDSLTRKSIFNTFPGYHRLAYTHNPLANTLLHQFMVDIDTLTPMERLYLKDTTSLIDFFPNDIDIGTISQNRSLNQSDDGYSYSLFLSRIYEYFTRKRVDKLNTSFPRGVPNYGDYNFYLLEDGIDWLSDQVKDVPSPFFGYYHFYPPHDPYNTRIDFIDAFVTDHYDPVTKEVHFFQNKPKEKVEEQHRWYDEFILYVDSEIARLFNNLEENGFLENTWIILTSDHGEMFERNIMGHAEPVFYQPLIRVPLLIFPPGGGSRIDIYDNTSAVDLLPTLNHIADQSIPGWSEGVVLPPFSETSSLESRDISAIQVEALNVDESVDQATAFLVRGRYKLVWYFGYEQIKTTGEFIELYDITADPEEIHNLYPQEEAMANDLLDVLKSKLSDLNHSLQAKS
jgi:choline-sulfatase